MKSNFAEWAQIARRFVAVAAVAFAIPMMASLRPACAVDLPSDDDQDVLVRTTLMTFNDANMTGNYSVFIAKASKQFQSQIAPEKLASSLESFRTNRLFFESVVTEDYESTEKPTIDAEGVAQATLAIWRRSSGLSCRSPSSSRPTWCSSPAGWTPAAPIRSAAW